jgi:hypothetical protein
VSFSQKVEGGGYLVALHLDDTVTVLVKHRFEKPTHVGDVEAPEIGAVVDIALGLGFLGDLGELGPGLGRVFHADAGLFQNGFVVVHDRRGDAVGNGADPAVELRVVPDAGIDVVLVEVGFLDFLLDEIIAPGARVEGAGGHQRHVRRRVGNQSRAHLRGGIAIVARIGILERDIVVRGVEFFEQRLESLARIARYRVPHLELCLRHRRSHGDRQGEQCGEEGHHAFHTTTSRKNVLP